MDHKNLAFPEILA